MEENKYDYTPEEGYENEEKNDSVNKTLKGYRIVIILLAIILAGVSVLYFSLNRQHQEEYAMLEVERNNIQGELTNMISEYDSLKFENDSIAATLNEASRTIEQLKNERRLNYNTIKKYQKEVGTLRAVMKNYLRQIDSLNTINKKLSGENVNLRQEISSLNLRADKAEEQAKEYQNKVKQGSILHARDITLVALNANDKVISRVKNAAKLRVDFTIGANELAKAGNRPIYLCITSPDGYLLSTDAMPTFVYQGVKKGYSESREVDYQNEDVDVSIFYKGSGFIPGTYKIELYMDGNKVGGTEVAVK
jgi:regulator of replication initiation timing